MDTVKKNYKKAIKKKHIVLIISSVALAAIIIKAAPYFGTGTCVLKALADTDRTTFTCERDNLTISGTVFAKKDTKNLRLPILIISHPFMANQLFSYVHAEYLKEMGYAVFTYDFNGGCLIGSSEGEKTDMSVLTEVEDLKAVIEYAKAQDYTDSENITLVGCSQGGFVSAITASELNAEIDKLILFYPALSIPDDARKGSMVSAEFDPKNVPETFYCGPMKLGKRYVTDILKLDAYDMIKNYTGKVMIVHGDKDSIVDISYSKRAYEVYKKFGANVELKIIKDADHVFFKSSDCSKSIEYVKDFLKP